MQRSAFSSRLVISFNSLRARCNTTFSVLQLHREFVRSGADVCQALTHRASDDNLEHVSRCAEGEPSGRDVNLAAVELARQAADDSDAYVSVSLCMSQNYEQGKSKDVVIADFRKQLQFFVDEGCKIDLIVCEVCHALISTYSHAPQTCASSRAPLIFTVFPVRGRDGNGNRSRQGNGYKT